MSYEFAAADELVEVDVHSGFVFRISYYASHISYHVFYLSLIFPHRQSRTWTIYHVLREVPLRRGGRAASHPFIFRITHLVSRIYFITSHFLRRGGFLVHYSYYLCIKLQGMSNWILIFIVQLNRTSLFA